MDDERYDPSVVNEAESTDVEQEPDDLDRSGAYGWDELLDEEAPEVPEEYENPAGVSRGDCDTQPEPQDESCALEATALTEDQVLEETKPGLGISGFEGEEVGGG